MVVVDIGFFRLGMAALELKAIDAAAVQRAIQVLASSHNDRNRGAGSSSTMRATKGRDVEEPDLGHQECQGRQGGYFKIFI